MNSVRLYSNGTAVISREYVFEGQEPLRISIPVRKTDLDDVISSLAVFGDVTITGPPTYTPTNADAPALALDPSSALRNLATKLVGASVEVEAGLPYKGKLLGLQPHRREFERTFLEQYRLVILTEKGVQQVEEASITAIRFTDAVVQAEIEKSLRSSLGKIKPDSSTIELTVQPNPGTTTAIVTYATPVAAWKVRYQIRMSSEKSELEGQAVVDNDTDDDWAETLITVITGEPITFSTDLAEVRRPARSRVNVVADRTIGAVVAEPLLPRAIAAAPPPDEKTRGGGYGGGGRGGGASQPSMAPRSMVALAAVVPELRGATDRGRAEQPQAEVRESGDFSVFTSPDPVDVGAKRSAIIPLFRTDIGEAQVILFYKEADDPQRPFRAVRFKNQAAHSLGRGVCEVFVDGDFQGKCVLEPTKPGEEALLIHAKETGVRVFKESTRAGTRRMAIRISEGAAYCEDLNRQETVYRVQNSHPETFPLEIEHPRTWPDSKVDLSISSGVHEAADIPGGQRIGVTLPAKGSLAVKVKEEQIVEQRFSLSASWLQGNVIRLKAPASPNKGIQECIDLQRRIDNLESEIKEREAAAVTIAEEQGRLMKLIPNGHGEQANAWRTDLANAEKELREIKRSVIPKLRGQLKEAQNALHKALGSLRYEWSKEPREEGR
jgi:hypothetical protein